MSVRLPSGRFARCPGFSSILIGAVPCLKQGWMHYTVAAGSVRFGFNDVKMLVPRREPYQPNVPEALRAHPPLSQRGDPKENRLIYLSLFGSPLQFVAAAEGLAAQRIGKENARTRY